MSKIFGARKKAGIIGKGGRKLILPGGNKKKKQNLNDDEIKKLQPVNTRLYGLALEFILHEYFLTAEALQKAGMPFETFKKKIKRSKDGSKYNFTYDGKEEVTICDFEAFSIEIKTYDKEGEEIFTKKINVQ